MTPPASPFRRVLIVCACISAAILLPLSARAAVAEGDQWVKVSAPEFTVITSLREKQAVAWAGEFAQFVAALQGYINIEPKRLPRLTLIVFARERDFARFRPLRGNGTTMEVAGFFSRRDSWAVAGVSGAGMSEETRSIVFHEGTHWFLSGVELPNPMWLEEGLAEVFSTFAVEGKNVVFGRAIEPHVQALRMRPSLPLEQLLFLPQDNLHTGGDEGSLRAGMAYAQSWAFVHYLVFGQRDVPKQSLIEYVRRLRDVHPDEAFRQAFGGSYAEVDRKLRSYLQSGRYYVAKQPLAPLPALMAQPASAVEVQDALARLRMAGGRHAAAREDVARVIAAAPEDPRSYELQGELEQESGDIAAARTAYQKAVDRGSKDFRPYYELAVTAHAGAGEQNGTVANLTPENARVIANGYERSINSNPRFRPAYQGLAGVAELLPPGNTEDARFLEFGLKLFPDDAMIRLGLATIAKRGGDHERARTLLTQVLGSPISESHAMAYARRLEIAWMERDVFAQVNALAEEKKFEEAIRVVDRQLKDGVNFATRQRLTMSRDQLFAAQLLEEARAAMPPLGDCAREVQRHSRIKRVTDP